MTATSNRTRFLLTILGPAALSMLAMLIVAQAVLYVEDSESTETIAEAVVARAETVSQARRGASDAALTSTFALCSDADIRALKEVAFDSSYMSDVGRIQDGHLLCSALWGRIVPFRLPTPHYSSGETKLWNTSDLVGSPYGGTNLIAQGRTFTVSSPSSFEGLDPAKTSTFTVETRDRSYVFRRVVPAPDASENASSRIGLSRCSNKANICAFVSRPRRGVWDLAPSLLYTIIGIGATLGVTLSYLLIRRNRTAKQTLQQRFSLAMRRNEIELVYQPLYTVVDRRLVGFEVLSRWTPPGEGEISPGIFVPMARQLGLSSDLFRYVLSKSLREMAPVLGGTEAPYLSINAEPVDMAPEDAVRFVASVTRQAGVLPDQVRIEITEREELVCPGVTAHMAALAALGFRFLIDDFGTGSSNFSHLAQSPFIGIKIDRMFVAAITEESPLRPVLPGMYQIARQLGLEVIVEGVETAEQDTLLQQIAPSAVGQGWLYGVPFPAETAVVLARSHRGDEPFTDP
ncbi:diguanylate cyclase/phosphodiesterase (GGDEF & EAL domains) with PAS/PAC sensor(s) [plant metagenome]|uniref:cyclic-guanylate-specific phosphodiesterase n=1 Tax=plant metagenome TaxID=1297885 RepID=A0A484V5W3_9ZZZZ